MPNDQPPPMPWPCMAAITGSAQSIGSWKTFSSVNCALPCWMASSVSLVPPVAK